MVIEINPSIVTIDGVDYYAHPATVTSVKYFTEDHGILTNYVHLDLATGGSQGFGGYTLDGPNGKYSDTDSERPEQRPWTSVKTRSADKFAGEYLLCLTKLLGENPRGKTVFALKEESVCGGMIVGLATLDGDYFLPKLLAKALFPERN